MNKHIVKAKERLFILKKTKDGNGLYPACLMLFFLLFSGLVQLKFPFISKNFIFILCNIMLPSLLLSAYSLVFLNHNADENESSVFDFIYALLHYILPNKKERDLEFLAFCENYNKNKKSKEKAKFIENDIFQVSQENLFDWIKVNIGDHKSIHNLIIPRCFDDSRFKKEILYWSQLIPSKKLTLDDLRLLLLTNKITSKSDLFNFDNFFKSEIESFFINYEAKDIVKLFTTSYNLRDYLEILKNAKKYKLELPVYKNISRLLSHTKTLVAQIEGNHFYFKRNKEWISQIEVECEIGSIVMIDNYSMLVEWATYMRNCILSRKDKIIKEKSYLFGIFRDSQPYIVFEVSEDKQLLEATKKANNALSNEELRVIKNIIQNI